MSETEYNVRAAAARVGGLSAYGKTPDPEVKAEAERSLATARIDREIRESLGKYGPLEPVQADHLIGLILSFHHVKGETFSQIAKTVREAVAKAGE